MSSTTATAPVFDLASQNVRRREFKPYTAGQRWLIGACCAAIVALGAFTGESLSRRQADIAGTPPPRQLLRRVADPPIVDPSVPVSAGPSHHRPVAPGN